MVTGIRYGRRFDILTFSVSSQRDEEIGMSTDRRLVEFLGANVLDDKPFIVMPYLKHGNAREYLLQHPNSDRLQIVSISNICIFVLTGYEHEPLQLHDISLGLVYLHSHHIVHGDLKAVCFLDPLRCICTTYGKLCFVPA